MFDGGCGASNPVLGDKEVNEILAVVCFVIAVRGIIDRMIQEIQIFKEDNKNE